MSTILNYDEDLLYPESDGKPMAENTEQYRWIVMIKENLEILFARDAQVFIAADLLWYPEPVLAPPAPSQAPDVMVVFGRPKGPRRSYRQWQEENIPPQVVFEILSDSNKTRQGRQDMANKFRFYEKYGVEEYYIYDPDDWILGGWLRQDDGLQTIEPISDWVSPRLQIRFDWQPGQELVVYRLDGQQFLSPVELDQQLNEARQQAEQERQRAEQERQRAEQAEQSRYGAARRLREIGMDTAQISEILGMPIEEVQNYL
jgi:Uma2 family endonuclease